MAIRKTPTSPAHAKLSCNHKSHQDFLICHSRSAYIGNTPNSSLHHCLQDSPLAVLSSVLSNVHLNPRPPIPSSDHFTTLHPPLPAAYIPLKTSHFSPSPHYLPPLPLRSPNGFPRLKSFHRFFIYLPLPLPSALTPHPPPFPLLQSSNPSPPPPPPNPSSLPLPPPRAKTLPHPTLT